MPSVGICLAQSGRTSSASVRQSASRQLKGPDQRPRKLILGNAYGLGTCYRSGPLDGLAQVQEPGGTGGEARGRGGLEAMIGRSMASFLSRNPGVTTGPAGIVHSVKLSEYGIWEGPLMDEDKANLLINMHDYWCGAKVDRELVVTEIRRKRYFIDQHQSQLTSSRVFKMLKKEHADLLCERGCLGLGPLNYYTTVENEKIADEHEGMFITYAEGSRYSIASVTGAGSHVLVYCTTKDTNARFDYDACVEISQPAAFSELVANAVAEHFRGRNELVRVEHSKCVYQHSRVIAGRLHGFSEALVQIGELSVDTIDVLSDKKYLIKESTHAKDSEYRFAIVMRTDVPNYTVINCPQVVRFCRRVR